MQYIVAGLSFSVEGLALPHPWPLFEKKADSREGWAFSAQVRPLLPINRDISYLDLPETVHFFRSGDSFIGADEEYRNFHLFPSAHGLDPVVLAYLFYTHAIGRDMLQLHASVIRQNSRGIVFLGPSGIGKTTQAERWVQYGSAEVINGDVCFVQRTPEEYLAWGTPWHGSSPYCMNTSVPVKALVVLKQAPYNALRELTGFEKVQEVSGNVFYPRWLKDGQELGVNLLNHLLTDLPVYRLDNRADEEAVRLLAAEMDRIS